MQILLVHHAEAVGPDVDPQRPLSERGLGQAASLAERARAKGFAPAAIWHSGKLRARQTGEPLLRLSPFAAFKMVRGLLPDDPPAMMRDALRDETRDLAIVGHMPNLAGLLESMTGGPFPIHGAVAVATDDGGMTWKELWRIETAPQS